ncbi:MAG: hypothetical protein EBV03_00395 [Proteobacteria bacterium]|nr:hypothetical protein [Pseudomonadota bacterium]
MIVRKMHDEKLPEKQRELLVENSALLNMRFIANTIRHYAGAASLVDDTMLWDRNSDALKDIIRKNKLKMLVPMDAFFRTTVRNHVVSLMTRDKHRKHSVPMSDEIIEVLPGAQPANDTREPDTTDAGAMLQMLHDFKGKLKPDEQRLMDIMLSCNAEEESLYDRVAEEMQIPAGTAKTRIFRLRSRLAEMPELVEALGDALGESYAEQFANRNRRSGGEGSGGGNTGRA